VLCLVAAAWQGPWLRVRSVRVLGLPPGVAAAVAGRVGPALRGAPLLLGELRVPGAVLGPWGGEVVVRGVTRRLPDTLLVRAALAEPLVSIGRGIALGPTGEVIAVPGLRPPRPGVALCLPRGCALGPGAMVGPVAAAAARSLVEWRMGGRIAVGPGAVVVGFATGSSCLLGPVPAQVAEELLACRALVGKGELGFALGANGIALARAGSFPGVGR